MKKLLIPFLALLLTASCKEDFNIAAPYKNITLVYATLNRNDTAHYFRIQKAFLDQNKSAIEMSKIPDSNFYPNLNVVVQEYENNAYKRTFPALTEVRLEDEGYPKDAAGSQGFFTAPSKAYKLKLAPGDSLDPYKYYKLIIKNNLTGEVDSSDPIYVVNTRTNVKNANDFQLNDFDNLKYALNFAKTELKASYNLIGKTPKNARIIEGIMRFNFVEKDVNTGKTKRLPPADFYYNTLIKYSSEQFTLSTLNSSIYSFLRDAYGAAPSNVERYVDSCDLFVYAGSNELYNYVLISGVQNSSLLGDQIKPFYTNMRGTNAYGLICSRALRVKTNVPIDAVTLDSLRLNPVTAAIGIKGRSAD